MPQPLLSARRVRLQCDIGTGAIIDILTGSAPAIPQQGTTNFEVGLFLGLGGQPPTDASVVDLSGGAILGDAIQSLSMFVRTAPNASTNTMAKTVSSGFENLFTAAEWAAGTDQHAIFAFSDSETNITASPPAYSLGLLAITVSAAVIPLGICSLTVNNYGVTTDAADPAVNPGDALSLGQADARYLQSAVPLPATAFQNGVTSAQTVSVPAGYVLFSLSGFSIAAGGALSIAAGGIQKILGL